MNVDMQALLRGHGVEITVKGKHTTPGWINMRCPFCQDASNHLGWNVGGQYFNCWKCGSHGLDDTLAELLGVGYHEVPTIKSRYAMRPSAAVVEAEPEVVRPQQIVVPGADLGRRHYDYLRRRDYDPYRLACWQLQGTDHLARGHEKLRIFCPIYHDGRVVSWQGRDITGRNELRWYSCPKEKELRDHKHCLGGEQLVPADSVAIVEGFTDAWRLGRGAVCTFGTDYLAEQVFLLKRYRRRFVVLDAEAKDPNARLQADKLCHQLSAFGGETILVELDADDPGALDQEYADYLMEKEWRVR